MFIDKKPNVLCQLYDEHPFNGISIDFENRCNLNCKYCYSNHSASIEDLDLGLRNLEVALDSLYSHIRDKCNIFHIHLWGGGEPTLDINYFGNFIRLLKDLYHVYGVKSAISFSTNGVKFENKPFVEKFSKLFDENVFINELQFSFDGMFSSSYYRGISFDVYLKAIDNILKYLKYKTFQIKSTFTFESVMKKFFIDDLVSLFELQYKINNNRNIFYNFAINDAVKDCKYKPDIAKVYVDKLLQTYNLYLDNNMLISEPYIYPFLSIGKRITPISPVCGLNTKGAIMLYRNGDIYSCHRGVEGSPLKGNYILNTRNNEVVELNGTTFKTNACLGCDAFVICGGTCPLESYKLYGTYYKPNQDLCKFYREAFYYLSEERENDVVLLRRKLRDVSSR